MGLRPPDGGAHGRRPNGARRRDGRGRGPGDRGTAAAACVSRRHGVLAPQRRGRPRPPASPGRPGRRGVRRADAALRLEHVRSRREPASRRRAVGRDRPCARARRDLPLPTDRRRHQPRADRLHDGPAAGQREPRVPNAPAPRPRRWGSRWSNCSRARAGSSSSTWAPWSTSSARCTGRCRDSRPRATPTASGRCTSSSRATACSCPPRSACSSRPAAPPERPPAQ